MSYIDKYIISIKELWYWNGQNRLKRSNLFGFCIFQEFSQNCLTQANFDSWSWNFSRKGTSTILIFDTKFFENRSGPFNFERNWIFLSWYQILKIRCVHEASSVRKPKLSNVIPQRKNFVKSARKQYGNPDSHVFF